MMAQAKYDSITYQIQNYDKKKWDEYEKVELAWFVQDARDTYTDICINLGCMRLQDPEELLKRIKELRIAAAKAQPILDDWQRLKEHMDENPTIKEEWEGLLMAIRLTEDED